MVRPLPRHGYTPAHTADP